MPGRRWPGPRNRFSRHLHISASLPVLAPEIIGSFKSPSTEDRRQVNQVAYAWDRHPLNCGSVHILPDAESRSHKRRNSSKESSASRECTAWICKLPITSHRGRRRSSTGSRSVYIPVAREGTIPESTSVAQKGTDSRRSLLMVVLLLPRS